MATNSKDAERNDDLSDDKITPTVAPLFHTIGLWLSLFFPILLAVVVLVTAAWGSGLELEWSPAGLRTFYEYFKIPIALASLSIPLGALTAAHHRSLQTFEQTKKQNVQNLFNNHLQHKKEFREFFEEFRPFKHIETFNAWEMYETLFPLASEGNYAADPQIHKILNEILTAQNHSISQFDLIDSGQETPASLLGLAIGGFFMAGEIYEKIGAKLDLFSERYNKPNAYELFFGDLFVIADGLISCCNFQYPSIPKSKRKKIAEEHHVLLTKIDGYTKREEIASLIQEGLEKELEKSTELLFFPAELQFKVATRLSENLLLDTEERRKEELEAIIAHHLSFNSKKAEQEFLTIKNKAIQAISKLTIE